ncbi:MAG: hypothetical protein J5733_11730 [Bacteroidaceae bacterium]|nr:hypothetical protein [Bacteroidaceae bacterium]
MYVKEPSRAPAFFKAALVHIPCGLPQALDEAVLFLAEHGIQHAKRLVALSVNGLYGTKYATIVSVSVIHKKKRLHVAKDTHNLF